MTFKGIVDEKYLVYKDRVTQPLWGRLPALHFYYNVKFWSDRYVLQSTDDGWNYWNLTISDLLMNESRQIRFRKSFFKLPYMPNSINVFLFENEFGIVIEHFVGKHYVSFVKTDWSLGEFHLIDQFVRKCGWLSILMDSLKPTKLVLQTRGIENTLWSYQMCSIVGSKFQFSNRRQTKSKFHQHSNGKLIGFKRQGQKIVITSYDWNAKQEQVSEIDFVPERFRFVCGNSAQGLNEVFWFQGENVVIIGGNSHCEAGFFNGNFIVYATNQNDRNDGMRESTARIYNIPVRRPHSLRRSAWMLLVNMMKRKGEIDLYNAAKKFLPLNTDLRSPWFEDKASDESSQESDDGIPPKRVKSS